MNVIVKRIIRVMLITILITTGLNETFISTRVKAEDSVNQTHGKISNNEDISKFMNNYFKENMEKYNVPGAAVVVVKDNKEVFKSGYGYSDLESKVKVDPDKTSFPAGSVSKLFTATAIMQLYENGKIDLDKNINYYISPYKVNNKYSEDVTCRNILTHSSGLDEASELNGTTTDENSIKSQEYFMDTHRLVVVAEPNTICRYSNEGYDVLGYIVERVSGMSYEEYVKENILNPLNMKNSSVRLKGSNTSIGYEYDDNGNYNVANPLAYQYTSGSAGIISTASDMENFITANLNNGQFQNSSILSQNSVNLMHSKQFSNSEALPGMGLGFIRSYKNGQEVIKHEGALHSGYISTLFLIPKENLGIYVTTNSLNGLPFNFEEEFLNYFYPQSNEEFRVDEKNVNKDYSKYEGTYRSYDGTSKTNIMKLNVLYDQSMDLKIKDNKNGTLTLNEISQGREEITTNLVEIEDGVFLREDGRGKFAFRFDKDGNVTYAFNDVSENSFEKIKFYENTNFIFFSIISILIITLINIFIFIRSLIKRKNRKQNSIGTSKVIKILRRLNFAIGIFNLTGIFGAVILAMAMIVNNNFNLMYLLYFFLTLLILSTGMTFINLILLIFVFFKKKMIIREKIYYSILSLANLLVVWLLYYFNLLGYKV